MFCEICGERIATLHFTKIINGQKSEFHLCENCVNKDNSYLDFDYNDFSFNHLLSGLLSLDQMGGKPLYTDINSEKCLTCGLTFSEFKNNGKFGCSDCYKYFANKLDPIFRRVHGNSRHNGKVPNRLRSDNQFGNEINKLKEDLKLKIYSEEFEEAAVIRDKIKEIEEKIPKDGDDNNVN